MMADLFNVQLLSLFVPHLHQVIMQWEKLKPPQPDDPLCCCECDIDQYRCCCDCEDLDDAFTR